MRKERLSFKGHMQNRLKNMLLPHTQTHPVHATNRVRMTEVAAIWYSRYWKKCGEGVVGKKKMLRTLGMIHSSINIVHSLANARSSPRGCEAMCTVVVGVTHIYAFVLRSQYAKVHGIGLKQFGNENGNLICSNLSLFFNISTHNVCYLAKM